MPPNFARIEIDQRPRPVRVRALLGNRSRGELARVLIRDGGESSSAAIMDSLEGVSSHLAAYSAYLTRTNPPPARAGPCHRLRRPRAKLARFSRQAPDQHNGGAFAVCSCPEAVRTATPAINGGKRRQSAALSGFEPPFLNGMQRSVNRKVQGANPWSGADFEFERRLAV